MKVALVHDWLHNTYGGAERVLLEMSRLFPGSDVYTILFNEEKFDGLIDKERVQGSYLQKLPEFMNSNRKILLPFIKSAVKSWDFDSYDLVISSSSAFVKNINTKNVLHICYCHTPARFLWDYEEKYLNELENSFLVKKAAKVLVGNLKEWDKNTSKVDEFIANSETVAKRINSYYGRSSKIIYPPVNTSNIKLKNNTKDFYVTLATLTKYKKIDLVVRAFNKTDKKLIIMGDGPERESLESIAKGNISFTGFVSDDEKLDLLSRAKGLIFPNEEDFGIAPVESMAAGTPVIAYNKGGVTETVIDQQTGILFNQQNEEGILNAISKAEKINFNAKRLNEHAKKFSTERFNKELLSYISDVTKK